MEVIGLSGYARSGKDEAAKVLVEEFGFTRVAFADKLRDFLYALNPTIMAEYDGQGHIHNAVSTVRRVIDHVGWDGYKKTIWATPIRELLQRLGTEAGRQTMWDTIWIDAVFKGLSPDAKVVVTDCRFPNEAMAILLHEGQVWRIVREGVGPANDHPSETSLDDWPFDAHIHNDGSLEDYRKSIKRKYLERISHESGI